jgi:hypothetical protein
MAVPIKGGFGGVKETSYEAVVGTHNWTITDVKFVTEPTEETLAKFHEEFGDDEEYPGYIAWEMTGADEDIANRKCWPKTPVYGEGRGRLKQLLGALGHTPEEIEAMTEIEPTNYIGRVVRMKTKADRNNEDQTFILRYMPAAEDSSALPA